MKETNRDKGITLIALVVTIVVLMILAGISIAMLSGEHGVIRITGDARTKTIHAKVLEELKIKEVEYLKKEINPKETITLIEYLNSKSIIGNEIGENSGKYQINVEALLGTKEPLGNGDATQELKDVYLLEQQNIASNSTKNTRVATTMPIRIAATITSEVKYKIIYYGKNSSDYTDLGSISDDITT